MSLFRNLAAVALVAAALAATGAAAQQQPDAGGGPAIAQPPIVAQPPVVPPAQPAIVPPALPQPQVVAPPPLPVAPAPTVYFVEQNGQPAGPFTMDTLKAQIAAGTLKGDTLVWKQGAPGWAAAKEVAEVAALLPIAPPPVPAGEQYRRLMIGTWQVQQANNLGFTSTSTYTYNADGSYNGVTVQTFQGMTLPTPENGTWTVQAVSQGSFTLSMTQQAAATAFGGFAGSGGMPPVTAVLRVVDNNTLSNDAAGYQARRIR